MAKEDLNIPLACPACGKETVEKLGRLQADPVVTCKGCGVSYAVEGDEFAGVVRAHVVDRVMKIRRKPSGENS